MTGALAGLRGIELAGQGPTPFCAALLADHGAQITRIVAPSRGGPPGLGDVAEPMLSGRDTIELDLKDDGDRRRFFGLVAAADFLLEGYRPGVVERLGIGPGECAAVNPRLVFARITGWGQTGPLAQRAGHDIDYIAITGALDAIGPADRPIVPLNLIGDYAGGAMFAAFGVLAALIERQRSGLGQVIDAAMVDGAGYLMAPYHELLASGGWSAARATNLLDGTAPFYRVYVAADGRHLAVGALEPVFFAQLCRGLGVEDDPAVADQYDRSTWPTMSDLFAARFASRPRSDWLDVFEGTDACVAAVLSLDEAPDHPHAIARDSFLTGASGTVPVAAPRLSRTPGTRHEPRT